MPDPCSPDATYTTREASDESGLALATIRHALHRGEIEAHKVQGPHGMEWRINRQSFQEWRQRPKLQTPRVKPRHAISRTKLLDALRDKMRREQLTQEQAAQQMGLRRASLSDIFINLSQGKLPWGDTLFRLLRWLHPKLDGLSEANTKEP